MSKIKLDSIEACREELQRVSNDYVVLVQEYIGHRERDAELGEQLELIRAVTLVDTEGKNADEREAKVVIAMRDQETTNLLMQEHRRVEAELEILKQRFKALEVRGGHAQSAIRAHEQEARFGGYD